MRTSERLFREMQETGEWDRIKSQLLNNITCLMVNDMTDSEAGKLALEYRVTQNIFATLEQRFLAKEGQ